MSFLGFIVALVIILYLFFDAPKHGKNRILWAVLGFFFGLLTVIIYLFKTKRPGWGFFWIILWIILVVIVSIVVIAGGISGSGAM